jgi:phage-related baseplate assembly protein
VFAVDAYNDQMKYSLKFGVPDNFVFLWVLPQSGGEISPDLRQRIATELENNRLTAIDVSIKNANYDNWVLNATVNFNPEYDPSELRVTISDALIGAFGRDNATFKNNVRRSKIISTIQSIEGVDYVTLPQPAVDIVADENTVLRLLANNINLVMVQS